MNLRQQITRLPRFGVVDGVIAPHHKGTMVRLDDVLALLPSEPVSTDGETSVTTGSAGYYAVNPLTVRREDETLWTDCPECPGWTAAADSWPELFRLVSEWHADKGHGWTMVEPFARPLPDGSPSTEPREQQIERRLEWLESAARLHNAQLRAICSCPKTTDGPRTATDPACLVHGPDHTFRASTEPPRP